MSQPKGCLGQPERHLAKLLEYLGQRNVLDLTRGVCSKKIGMLGLASGAFGAATKALAHKGNIKYRSRKFLKQTRPVGGFWANHKGMETLWCDI